MNLAVGVDPTILVAALVVGYLFGTIAFGLILTKLFGLGDLRSIGSGNIGATNVLRTGNKKVAALTLLGDLLKATVPVLIFWRWGAPAAAFAGFGAFIGHLFPVWLGFRGGKGVATYIGVLLGFAPIGVLVFAAVWLGAAKIWKFSSLAALLATLVVPVVYLTLGNTMAAGLTAILTVLVYIKHASNIRRLLAGTESKIGSKG
ncbi:glycerol-3-phosphate 1-O-acyltransferase PlsY [Aureimonas phyllosphaerae]|uniref:Glycerol-3-phosphate acyltransferase n=1 Tax=Aureimonas phyllosphaerae TaxID=1166078 RepID=A0A7W6BX44_9HYPH|nr:glycerol-3-phosphate 1-O-acyltransferase PlsY [Aureimonas phyllosphaerae]MBB3935351.1 glycerol-3-phosphate acyltransferase PlsY [Aureimonas phyllosphaerae]MBB3959359.1 glycerol-3-phosphate acyltransferase PlsY [Aureimonas phyllosphaerae]SFF04168.1 acyl-phosphate glycerol-3-phosphate acyltransferase [Aureimonas phyllosphaerae]